MEQITRAKTMLYILMVDDDIVLEEGGYGDYSKTKGYFQQAAEAGLVVFVKLNDANEGNEGLEEDEEDEEEDEEDEGDEEEDEEDEGNEELDEVKEVNKGDSCLPGCCTS